MIEFPVAPETPTGPMLALKIDVETYRGTRDGVPRLVEILKQRQAGATFLFSLGPDQTGRALRYLRRRHATGRKARRYPLLSRYGFASLLYGTLLPSPNIGRRCEDTLRAVRDAGFEVGIHAWNAMAWQKTIARADAATLISSLHETWTRTELEKACERFKAIFGEAPRVHGAAGWLMNRHAWRLTQRLGFDYASDTRGRHPFVPLYEAEIIACPQLPTTLPTLDELIVRDGVKPEAAADAILDLTREPPATGHVYTLRAELEGNRLAEAFEGLLTGWKAQGYRMVSLRDYFDALPSKDLPRHDVTVGPIDGRVGELALQGDPFLPRFA